MTESEPDAPAFEDFLEYLRVTRRFDFTGYKRASLRRRIEKRMQDVGIDGFDAYRDYVEVHPDEFEALFNTILINVTAFFRDPEAWDYLRDETIPAILAAKAAGESVRVWSAGCASGEEAYTAAMLFAEALGREAYLSRVKVYATDVDEEALRAARLGRYRAEDLEPVPDELRDRYFKHEDGDFVFNGDVRRNVIFGRLDLVQDAPISRLDLLICRNTLMYFDAETQNTVLTRMHFALGDPGYVFLGRAEMMLSRSDIFAPVNMERRIFRKVGTRAAAPRAVTEYHIPVERDRSELKDIAFDEAPVPQLICDVDGHVIVANHEARAAFEIDLRDVGRPLKDLEISYRPVDLRTLLDEAKSAGVTVERRNIERLTREGELQHFDAKVQPITSADETYIGMNITFTDVTDYMRQHRELLAKGQELETTTEELQSTNEELETTNEELQSTIEELETTNEELQSTNEELETMNEELRSSNDELETMNTELRARTDELDSFNAFVTAVLGSFESAIVVVDASFEVLVWNARATELWGLRADEAEGSSFLGLDIGLPVELLADAVRGCLQDDGTGENVELDATTRRGRAVLCRVACSPLRTPDGDRLEPGGVVLEMQVSPR